MSAKPCTLSELKGAVDKLIASSPDAHKAVVTYNFRGYIYNSPFVCFKPFVAFNCGGATYQTFAFVKDTQNFNGVMLTVEGSVYAASEALRHRYGERIGVCAGVNAQHILGTLRAEPSLEQGTAHVIEHQRFLYKDSMFYYIAEAPESAWHTKDTLCGLYPDFRKTIRDARFAGLLFEESQHCAFVSVCKYPWSFVVANLFVDPFANFEPTVDDVKPEHSANKVATKYLDALSIRNKSSVSVNDATKSSDNNIDVVTAAVTTETVDPLTGTPAKDALCALLTANKSSLSAKDAHDDNNAAVDTEKVNSPTGKQTEEWASVSGVTEVRQPLQDIMCAYGCRVCGRVVYVFADSVLQCGIPLHCETQLVLRGAQ